MSITLSGSVVFNIAVAHLYLALLLFPARCALGI